MKLATRATVLGKKITLISTAFILAVSTLTASVPFVLSQRVGALAADVAEVRTGAELVAAAKDVNVRTISVKASFSVDETIVLSGRNVYIDGNANKISFAAGAQGSYVIQAYQITLGIKNLTVSGANGGVFANGSTLNLQGRVDVSDNVWGGIEVSQGRNVTTPARLNVGTAVLVNLSESNTKPTAWIDGASSANAAVTGPFTETTHIGNDQKQYYLDPSKAGIFVRNISKSKTYSDLQLAIDASSTTSGDTIQLARDITLNLPVQVNKGVTIDGNGKTVTSSFDRTSNQQNAAFVVTASGASLKNMTVTTSSQQIAQAGFPTKPHGVVVYNANSVVLTNVSLNNNLAGLIVNGSKVTVENIHTSGNLWYGVNVDKTGAVLTVRGNNTHSEAKDIFVDDSWTGAYVIDQLGKYNKEVSGRQITYNLDESKPIVQSIKFADGKDVSGSRVNAGVRTVTATITDEAKTAVNFTNFEIRKGSAFKGQGSGGSSLTPSFQLDTSGFAEGADYTLRVYGRDNNGNTFSETVPFTVDRTTPTVTSVTYSNNGNPTRNNVEVIVTLSEDSIAPQGWNQLSPNQFVRTFTDNTDSTQVSFTDIAGNSGTFTYDVNGIDRSVIGAIAPISRTTTTPIISGVLSYNVDGEGVADQPLDIYVDGQLFQRRTNGNGIWTISNVTLANNASHTVAVFIRDADATDIDNALDSETFTTVVPIVTVPSAPELQQNPAPAPLDDRPNGGLPLTTFGAAQVLGSSTVNNDAQSEGTPEVAGSTADNLAQAVDADNTDGTAMGLAWYWWLLILAGLSAIVWGIVAAIRGRQST